MAAIIGFFTDYQQGKWLDQLLAKVTYTPPANLYLGLSGDAPTRLLTMREFSTSTGYARMVLPSGFFGTASNGTTSNVLSLTMPSPTADWGTVRSILIYDALTNGNLIAVAGTADRPVVSGGLPVTIPVGALLISRS